MTNDEGPLTIRDAAPLIRSGALTPSDLLEQCLKRIDVYEPHVKAWVYVDRERARKDAARLTDELKSGTNRGALHGIPIGIKDIIDVFDMPTGCGSKLWANSYARQDATCVERLRQAGAIILGKTVTTAYAYLDPPITRNPWNLDRTPGGSSSGSAAAVACGMCLAALGTQTGGSLTRPASYCGVCSLKPCYGRVSTIGVLPLAGSLDHVGVMANCVWDLAVTFQAISGPESRFIFNIGRTGEVPDILSLLDDCVETPDIRRLGGLFDSADSVVSETVDNAMGQLKSNDPLWYPRVVPPPAFADLANAHRAIMSVEAAENHGERFDRQPEDYPVKIRTLIEEGERVSAVRYRKARLLRDDLEELITRSNLGRFFATPATVDLPPALDSTGNPAFNVPWSFTGHPTVSLPVGWSPTGLPIAVQIVGSFQCVDDLLVAAAWCERALAFEHRLPPVPR